MTTNDVKEKPSHFDMRTNDFWVLVSSYLLPASHQLKKLLQLISSLHLQSLRSLTVAESERHTYSTPDISGLQRLLLDGPNRQSPYELILYRQSLFFSRDTSSAH